MAVIMALAMAKHMHYAAASHARLLGLSLLLLALTATSFFALIHCPSFSSTLSSLSPCLSSLSSSLSDSSSSSSSSPSAPSSSPTSTYPSPFSTAQAADSQVSGPDQSIERQRQSRSSGFLVVYTSPRNFGSADSAHDLVERDFGDGRSGVDTRGESGRTNRQRRLQIGDRFTPGTALLSSSAASHPASNAARKEVAVQHGSHSSSGGGSSSSGSHLAAMFEQREFRPMLRAGRRRKLLWWEGSGSGQSWRTIRQWVVAHNIVRKQFGLPRASRLLWDRAIARVAQTHADFVARSSSNCAPEFNEAGGGQLGENIFWGVQERGASGFNVDDVVAAWAEQKRNVESVNGSMRCKAGTLCAAFLQIVDANATRFGCGEAVCRFASAAATVSDRADEPGEFDSLLPSSAAHVAKGTAWLFVCNYYSPSAAVASSSSFTSSSFSSLYHVSISLEEDQKSLVRE